MNRRIMAVSLNTFRDYFFTPSAIILLIILLLTPLLCSRLLGDGTAEGKFRVFVTYSFIISSIVFTAINISVSCSSVSSEWKKKTLLTLDVKPIRRWEIILGKWMGMLFINIVLVFAFILAMSLSSILVSRELSKNYPEHMSIFRVETELLPSATFTDTDKEEALQSKPSGFLSFLSPTSQNIKGVYTVAAGGNIGWVFKGIHSLPVRQTPLLEGESENIYLSYRFQTSGTEGQTVSGYWLAGNPSLTVPFEVQTNLPKDQIHRLPIPIKTVSDKGELNVGYFNIDPSNLTVLFPKSDFKILYPQGNYWINLLKGGINILILAAFIYSVGLCFSCVVSHLTAILSTSILICISYMHEFIAIMLDSIFSDVQLQQNAETMINRISYPVLKLIYVIFPPLNDALPHSYIGSSLLIPSDYLFALFIRIIILGALPLLIVATIYLSYRELGIPNE